MRGLEGVSRIVFDLDDTLYLERDFVRSGFAVVAEAVRVRHEVDGFRNAAEKLFDTGRRGDVFNRALEELGAQPTAADIAELVDVYRSHAPRIELAPDAARLFAELHTRFPAHSRIALISDGPAATQARKLDALGIAKKFNSIVLTGHWGAEFSKPHPRAFLETARRLGGSPEQFVYIADNRAKDFIQPRRLGWRSICIRRKKGLYAAVAGVEAEREIVSLDEL